MNACLRDSCQGAVRSWRACQGGKRADLAAILVSAWAPELLPARSAQGGLRGGGPWKPQSLPSVRGTSEACVVS